MSGLEVEITPFVGEFPAFDGAQNQEVGGATREVREEGAGEQQARRGFAEVGIAGIPGAVFGVESIELTGCAVEVDEDAAFGGIAGDGRAGIGLGIAATGQREERRGDARAAE